MTKIVAFSGRKQSGKSTAGEYIEKLIKKNSLPISCKLYSFADPLKQDICINLLGLSYNQCYGTDEEKNSLTDIKWVNIPGYDKDEFMTAREVMEIIGTGIFRKIKYNIWVDATINKIKKDNFDLAILLDNRFPNEVDSVLNNEGLVIRLTKNPFNSSSKPETALDPDQYDWSRFSLIIDNEHMTIEQKENSIKNFLQHKGILPL
jgi:hypothetical protein